MIGTQILSGSVGGFLIGVLLRSFVPLGFSYVLFLVIVAGAVLMSGLFETKIQKSSIVLACAFLFCAGGIFRMSSVVLTGDPVLTAHLNSHVRLLGTVFAEPDVRDARVHLSVEVREIVLASTTIPVSARVLVLSPSHTEVMYGDDVIVSGILKLPQVFDTGSSAITGEVVKSGRQFDYPDYLGTRGIAYQVSFAHVETQGTNTGNIVAADAIRIKNLFLDGLHQVLPEPHAGLAGGITVGDKRSIGPELTQEFQKVSLVQILVLSGYNITVVANFFGWMLQWAPRFVQFGSGLFVVAFFMLISGGASSAVRAGLMAVIAMYARRAHRTYHALRALALVAFGMVWWNPFILAFDPGFQLSVLAMLGLVLGTPIVSARLIWVTERGGLRELIASSIATQIAVLPLIVFQDGQFSILAIPANILAMIPVPFAMLMSCIAGLGGMVAGAYATPIAFPAYLVLAYILYVARFFASLPFGSLSIGVFSFWWMCIAYVVLIIAVLIFKPKTPEHELGRLETNIH